MFESLFSVGALVALSVGAIFSFKIARVNLNLRNDVRNQSPDIHGDNNTVIFTQAMTGVRKEMAFSVKLSAFLMAITFHMFPPFYVNLLSSLVFILPLLSLVGVFYTIRANGFYRGWDVMYLLASIILSVIFYCSSKAIAHYSHLYPQLYSIFESVFGSGFRLISTSSTQQWSFLLIIVSSIACPALIVLGFYLAFSCTVARDGNDIFRYCVRSIGGGYLAYVFLSGVMFSASQGNVDNFVNVLLYPVFTLRDLFTF